MREGNYSTSSATAMLAAPSQMPTGMGLESVRKKVSPPRKRKSPGTSLVGEVPGLIVRAYILDASPT